MGEIATEITNCKDANSCHDVKVVAWLGIHLDSFSKTKNNVYLFEILYFIQNIFENVDFDLGSMRVELLYGLAFLDYTFFLGFLVTLYRSRLLIVYRQQAIVAVSAKKR